MIIVTGIAEIAEGDVEAIKPAARDMAVKSRAEDGCLAYAFYEDLEQAGRFRIFEKWESVDALRAHFATAHMQAFNKALSAVRVLKIEVEQFEQGRTVSVNS